METDPKKQRQHFYRDYASGQWSAAESRCCGPNWQMLDRGVAPPRYQLTPRNFTVPGGFAFQASGRVILRANDQQHPRL